MVGGCVGGGCGVVSAPMAGSARITNIAALADAKVALARFAHECESALGEMDTAAMRLLMELRQERPAYWSNQVRYRSELLARARSDLLRKQVSSVQDNPSVVDERKALERAKQRLEEAQEKVKACKRWTALLDREYTLFKGASSGLMDVLQRDMPRGQARLDQLVRAIESYQAVDPTDPSLGRAALGVAGTADASAGEGDVAARLRARSPSDVERLAAPPTGKAVDDGAVRAPGSLLGDGPILTALAMTPTPAWPESRAVVVGGCLDGRLAYLQRFEKLSAEDSGWFIGPVGDAMSASTAAAGEGLLAHTIDDVLRRRPAWREALLLPVGYLVIASGTGIEAVYNNANDLVWSAIDQASGSEPTPGQAGGGEGGAP